MNTIRSSYVVLCLGANKGGMNKRTLQDHHDNTEQETLCNVCMYNLQSVFSAFNFLPTDLRSLNRKNKQGVFCFLPPHG